MQGASFSSGEAWLSVTIGTDPELPRRPLRSVMYALRASTSEGLECSGCITAAHLDSKVLAGYVKAPDLAGFALKTDLADYAKSASLAPVAGSGSYADLKNTPKLADVATTGAYSDLTGVPVMAAVGAACGSGLVMRGILANGSYDCIPPVPAPATATTLGGVMVGNHLSVDAKGLLAVKDGDFLATSGGTLTGDLTMGKNQIKALRIDNLASAPVCDASYAGGMYFDTAKKTFFGCDGSKWWALNNNTPGTQANPGTSCKAILDGGGSTGSGAYWLTAGGQAYQTTCDMTTDGGGWTFIANIAMGDGNNWKHSAPTPNYWESTSTLGTLDPAANADFKSAAYANVAGKALLLTYKNAFLLRTDASCLGDNNLRAKLSGLSWESTGSQDYSSNPASTHPCSIAAISVIAGEKALVNGSNPAALYLKAGEADGAQDGNKDRAYISTSIRNNVDYPRGLGAFNGGACSAPNCENDVGGFNGDGSGNDIAVPGPGSDFYGIWVR